jgi:periplasmic protein CpxP/Spy
MARFKSTWQTATATAVAILLLGGIYAGVAYAGQRAFGGPGGPMMGGPRGMMLGMLAERLGLTDAQKEQIKSIVQQHRDEIAPLGKAARGAREALMDAAHSGADDGTLQQKANDLGAAESQLALATAKVQALIFQQVLTPDQQKKALELRDQMKSRMQERLQRRQSRGGAR